MRPVRTQLDGQVVLQRQAATRRAVKKAAGAEDMETVPEIDLGIALDSPIWMAQMELERDIRQMQEEETRRKREEFWRQYEK